MIFNKDKHSDGYVVSIHGVVSRIRNMGKVIDDVEMYSAEFNNVVKFNLPGEDAAKKWVEENYKELMIAIAESIDEDSGSSIAHTIYSELTRN